MKLEEWREAFLANMSGSGHDPDRVRHLFGKPYILTRLFRDIHICVIEGEPIVTTRLLQEGRLVFRWHGWDYGVCDSGEKPFAVPGLLCWQGIQLKDVEPFDGELDWNIEVPEIKIT